MNNNNFLRPSMKNKYGIILLHNVYYIIYIPTIII